jgi:hypothetical protein
MFVHIVSQIPGADGFQRFTVQVKNGTREGFLKQVETWPTYKN